MDAQQYVSLSLVTSVVNAEVGLYLGLMAAAQQYVEMDIF
jgi:hypothetical protein